MFSLALEMTATEELESLIPVSKAVMEILAPVSEAKVRSPSPEITTPIATTDDPSMPTADSPMEPTQKEMESSISFLKVVASVEEMDSLAPLSEAFILKARSLVQEVLPVPTVEFVTQVLVEVVGPIAKVHCLERM